MVAAGLLVCKRRPEQSPPITPAAPSGPEAGLVDSLYTFAVVTSDLQADDIAYRFAWGNGETSGWTAPVPSDTPVKVAHAWRHADTCLITAQAIDATDSLSGWSAAHAIVISEAPNHPPDTASTPIGDSLQPVGVELALYSTADDPDHDTLAHRFAWGDGDTSEWSGFGLPGHDFSESHAYLSAGTFTARIQVKDAHGALSSWSGGHRVTVSVADFPCHVRAVAHGVGGHSIAILPNGQYVYTLGESGDLQVIRTSDVAVVASVPMHWIGEEGNHLAVLPNGEYVYASAGDANWIWVVRTSDNQLVDSVRVGGGPLGMAALPNSQYLYVACPWSDVVSVIRTADDTVVASIPLGGGPWNVAVLPSGEFIYVTLAGGNGVAVIRTSDNSVVATVPVGRNPLGIAASDSGDYVYVSNWQDETVSSIRTADNSVAATIQPLGQPYGVACLPGNRYAYVTSWIYPGVLVIRCSDNAVVAHIPVNDDSPNSIAVHPDGSRVYVNADGMTVIGF